MAACDEKSDKRAACSSQLVVTAKLLRARHLLDILAGLAGWQSLLPAQAGAWAELCDTLVKFVGAAQLQDGRYQKHKGRRGRHQVLPLPSTRMAWWLEPKWL